MTLYINITQVEGLPNGGYLVVQGSRAGLLTTKKISQGQQFNPPFLIKCASDDVLSFKLAQSLKDYESNVIRATGSLHGQVLIKRYRNQLIYSSIAPPQQDQQSSKISNTKSNIHASNVLGYDIQLLNEAQQDAGVLHTTISYDRVSHFEGQFCATKQKITSKIGQKVGLFKGKCPTKNLFSLFDPSCQGQQLKFIESIYKDGNEEHVQ